MKPVSPNKSLQQRQKLAILMKKKGIKKGNISPVKSLETSSLNVFDDKMKAVELGVDTTLKCNFCGKGPASDDLKSGKFYRLHTMAIHFFCLLFAFQGEQRGEDEEGLNGFLVSDVRTQVDKGLKHKCLYCDKRGAMSKCQKKGCGKWLHFPCGLEAGATFQFLGSMDVFCGKHRIRQKAELLAATPPDYDCVVCYDEVHKESDPAGKIVVPCCHRHFHRSCVQNMALASGKHHFKCPNCNNNEIYVDEIEKLGIYIPNADATWETEEHSAFYNYRDMYVQERRCSVKKCLSTEEEGRSFHKEDGDFEVVLCKFCGTAGCHVLCGKLDPSDPEFTCPDCDKKEMVANEESDEEFLSDIDDILNDDNKTSDVQSDISLTGDEKEESDEYSDMIIKFLNTSGEMTSSCLKCGHAIPSSQIGAMNEHIKSKHINKRVETSAKNSSSSSSKTSTTSKTESSTLVDQLNELLKEDDDLQVTSASNNDDSFVRKFDDESDELDRLLKSVSDDDKESEVAPSAESIIQNFDDENDELEMLLKEIEDGDAEDTVVVNDENPIEYTKGGNIDVSEDTNMKQQNIIESPKSKVSEVDLELNEINQSPDLNLNRKEEPTKPKYKPGPKSRKHKLAVSTPEPPNPVSNSSDVKTVNPEPVSPKIALVNPIAPSNIDGTSAGKLASIKEKIAALQNKTKDAPANLSVNDKNEQDAEKPEPRYRPGPKSRKNKLLVTNLEVKGSSDINDTAQTGVSDPSKKDDIEESSVVPKYKPGPKSKKVNLLVSDNKSPTDAIIKSVDEKEVEDKSSEQNLVIKRSADILKPGPMSKKIKSSIQTAKPEIDNISSKYISNEDVEIITVELTRLVGDYNDNVFFIGDLKPKERHVIFTLWKIIDKSLPADSSYTLKCEQCNNCFGERSQLTEHMTSTCTKQFDLIFHFIEQKFIKETNINSAEKRIFDFIKEKIYSFFAQKWCFLCGKSVRMSTNASTPSYSLVSHMILCHFKKDLSSLCKMTKSPFLCPITRSSVDLRPCGLKFNNHSLLLSHLAGYHAKTDHILRKCSTINNLPGTKPLTKVCKCESCGKDVTNKVSLKIHIAIEKSDYEAVEKSLRNKCGEKDCSFQARFSSEELIRHFGIVHLEVASGKPVNSIKIAPMENLDNSNRCDELNNTLDGMYALSSDDEKMDFVQKNDTTTKLKTASKDFLRSKLRLVDINKLKQNHGVKEASPSSWYKMATKQQQKDSARGFIKMILPVTSSQPPSTKTPLPSSSSQHPPSVTPVHLPSVKSQNSQRISPATSQKTTSPATSQHPQFIDRNQTPPPAVLNNFLSTIADSSIQINKSSKTPSPDKTNPTVSLQSSPIESKNPTGKGNKTPSRNKTNPTVPLQASPIESTNSVGKGNKTPSRNKTTSTIPIESPPIQTINSIGKSNKTPSRNKTNPTVPNKTTLQNKTNPTVPPIQSINPTSKSTKTPSLNLLEPTVETDPSASTIEISRSTTETPAATKENNPPVSKNENVGQNLTTPVAAPINPVETVPAPTRRSKRPFSCPICNGSFKTLLILKTHLSNLHFHNRLLQRVLQNGSTFSCPENKCPFQNAKKEEVTKHIADEHDLVFKIAKELFPNFTTEPHGIEPVKESVSNDASKDINNPNVTSPQVSTQAISSDASTTNNDQQITATQKRRSTETIETDVKKQKLEKKAVRKVNLPIKPKNNVQTATIRPITRPTVTNQDNSTSDKQVQEKSSNPATGDQPQVENPSYQIASNVMIIPPTMMENGQMTMTSPTMMENGQMTMTSSQLTPGQMIRVIPGMPSQYLLTQGIMPQWPPASGNNQAWPNPSTYATQ